MSLPPRLEERGIGRVLRRQLNRLREELRATKVMQGKGYRVKHLSHGTLLELTGKTKTMDGGGVEVQRFKVTAIANDYLTCRKVDEDDEEISATDYYVLRPEGLRPDKGLPDNADSGSDATVDEQTRTYTVTLTGTGSSKTYTVTQKVEPPYAVGGFIYGLTEVDGGYGNDDAGNRLQTPDLEDYKWVDLNTDGRRWSWTEQEIEVCVNVGGTPTTRYMAVKGSEAVD